MAYRLIVSLLPAFSLYAYFQMLADCDVHFEVSESSPSARVAFYSIKLFPSDPSLPPPHLEVCVFVRV
jgi:hypothetical protein